MTGTSQSLLVISNDHGHGKLEFMPTVFGVNHPGFDCLIPLSQLREEIVVCLIHML